MLFPVDLKRIKQQSLRSQVHNKCLQQKHINIESNMI